MLTGLKVKRLRENITQREAANRLKIGVSAYSLIETGRTRPSQAQIRALEDAFGSKASGLLDPVQDDSEAS